MTLVVKKYFNGYCFVNLIVYTVIHSRVKYFLSIGVFYMKK